MGYPECRAATVIAAFGQRRDGVENDPVGQQHRTAGIDARGKLQVQHAVRNRGYGSNLRVSQRSVRA